MNRNNFETISSPTTDAIPQLLLSDAMVIVADVENNAELQELINNSAGSIEDWLGMDSTDSFGFDATSKKFNFLKFNLPESNEVFAESEALIDCNSMNGGIKLRDNYDQFTLEPFMYRDYNQERDALICFNDQLDSTDGIKKVSINQYFSIYFKDNIYFAWSLNKPELFLSEVIGSQVKLEDAKELKNALKSYLTLVTLENLEKMENDHEALIKSLFDLYFENKNSSDKGLQIISNKSMDIAERFYSSEVFNVYFKVN